jgi:hypothetical protein
LNLRFSLFQGMSSIDSNLLASTSSSGLLSNLNGCAQVRDTYSVMSLLQLRRCHEAYKIQATAEVPLSGAAAVVDAAAAAPRSLLSRLTGV